MSEAIGPQLDAERTPAEGETSDAELLEKFDRWEKALTAHWSEWREEAEEAYEYRDGHQWTPDDVSAMEDNGKIAVTFNLCSPTLDSVSGAEISNRQQVQYFPRQVESTGIADALTQGAEYVSDECNGDQEDSEAFRDVITCGVGWCLSGDAMVRLPRSHFATTRLYSGRVITIDLENGKQLTGTPNHPVLTNVGWKGLGALQEGDNLISGDILERVHGFAVEQFDKVEARLEDKVDAFRAAGEGRRFTTSSDDFYADGRGSEVHVVYADRALWDRADAAYLKKLEQARLVRRMPLADAIRRALLLGLGAFDSAVRTAKSYLPVQIAHTPYAYVSGSLRSAHFNSSALQMVRDGFRVSAKDRANLGSGKPCGVERDCAGNVSSILEASRSEQPLFPKHPHNLGSRYSDLILDFRDWKPILDVEARSCSGADFVKVLRIDANDHVDFPVHDIGTGVGFFIAGGILTSNTETRPDVDGEEVKLMKERVDPLQLRADPASRKACFEDARYLCRDIPMSQDEFEELKEEIGEPDAEGDDSGLGVGKRLTVVNPRQRYTNGMLGNGNAGEDEVIVHEWQWWEKEDVHLTAMPDPQNQGVTKITPLSSEDHTKAQKVVKDAGQPPLRSVKSTTKVYYRALVGGGTILHQETLKEGSFRYKAMTGKRDRKRGTWFGLMRPMIDPQRFTNKLFSEILHIVRTNANGGLMMEEGAVADIADFEDTFAATDKITWMANGSLSNPNGPRMKEKEPPPVQPALFQLMELAMDMVRKVTGVNDELLGLVGKEQAGVLEYQRKQAAYGILSPFFDAERRYRRDQGKLLLAQMRLYLPADKLMKVVDQGTQKYVSIAETVQAGQYDVIVDDAPSGPNSKAKVMQVLGPWMGPMVAGGILGPDAIADILPYMDLPAAVADKLATAIRGKMQMAQQVQQPIMEAEQAAKTKQAAADLDQTNADAEHKRAQAFKAVAASHISQVQLGREFLQAEQQAQNTQQQQEPDAGPLPQAAPPGVPGPGAPQPS